MAEKNGIWAFVLRILIQILNFILSKISRNGNGGAGRSEKIEYQSDEQENAEMKDKINNLIKDKLNK